MELREIGAAAAEVTVEAVKAAGSITRRLLRAASGEKPPESGEVRKAVSSTLRGTERGGVADIQCLGHIRFQNDQGGKITLLFDAGGKIISITSGLKATHIDHREDILKRIFQVLLEKFPNRISIQGWKPPEGEKEEEYGFVTIPHDVLQEAITLGIVEVIATDSSVEIFFIEQSGNS